MSLNPTTSGAGPRAIPAAKAVAANVLTLLPHRVVNPVFIVAPPRSGSTMLVEATARLPGLTGFVRQEADHIWNRVLPYSKRREPNDRLLPEDLGPWQRRKVTALLYREAVAETSEAGLTAGVIGRRTIRYLDKTISNCFHLDLLSAMFPDATFVYLLRDPRANIASMIAGWPQLARFGKPDLAPYLRAIPEARIDHWSYPAPPGWQTVVTEELPAICAWAWQQHVDAIIRHRSTHPGPLVRYEELLENPADVIEGVATELGVPFTAETKTTMRQLPPSRTSLAPPSPDKWRQHAGAIEAIMPMIAETASNAGY